jgi:hypothetical protein
MALPASGLSEQSDLLIYSSPQRRLCVHLSTLEIYLFCKTIFFMLDIMQAI